MTGFVMGHHRIEPQPPRIFDSDRRADNAGGMADDKRHLFGGAHRGRHNQVALAFAVIVVCDDDEFALSKGLQNLLDRVGHSRVSLYAGTISRTRQPAPARLRKPECRRPWPPLPTRY